MFVLEAVIPDGFKSKVVLSTQVGQVYQVYLMYWQVRVHTMIDVSQLLWIKAFRNRISEGHIILQGTGRQML